jgi:hypothetical protein
MLLVRHIFLNCTYVCLRSLFETRGGELIFSIYLILPAALGPKVYSVSNRNKYQKQKNNVYGE